MGLTWNVIALRRRLVEIVVAETGARSNSTTHRCESYAAGGRAGPVGSQ